MTRNIMIKIGIIGSLLFLVFPISADAYCTSVQHNVEMSKLLRIAANVNLDSIHHESDSKVLFDIRINNLHEKIKLFEKNEEKFIYYEQANTFNQYVIKGYEADQIVEFGVYPSNPECVSEDEVLLMRRITIPPFNKYYSDPLCRGRSDMLICFRWQRVELDREEFQNAIKRYEEEQKSDKKDAETAIDIFSLFDLVKENYHYLLYLGLVVLVILGYKWRKKKQDDFNL